VVLGTVGMQLEQHNLPGRLEQHAQSQQAHKIIATAHVEVAATARNAGGRLAMMKSLQLEQELQM